MAITKPETHQHFYINNCFGSFFRGVLNYFGEVFYDRFEYKVLGSYDKSVEFFNKKKQLGSEVDTNLLPSITLDPTYDFQPAEVGGLFFWQSQNFAPGQARMLFDSYEGFEDQSLEITPIFSKYQGNFELIFWVNSVYELLDIRTYLFQWSGGYRRKLRPELFESFIVLPEGLTDFKYKDIDDNDVAIDFDKSDLFIKKITNVNQDRSTMPVLLSPMFWFDNIADASNKYGGDGIAEYKLSVSVSFEIDIPTYVVVTPYMGLEKLNLSFSMDAVYSRYGPSPQYDETSGKYIKDSEGNIPKMYSSHEIADEPPKNNQFSQRAYYSFTASDEVITALPFEIDNPFDVSNDETKIIVVSYSGQLVYGQDWTFNDDKSKILVQVSPVDGELVEFYLYS